MLLPPRRSVRTRIAPIEREHPVPGAALQLAGVEASSPDRV